MKKYTDFDNIESLSALEEMKHSIDDAYEVKKRKLVAEKESLSFLNKSFPYLKECFEEMSPLLFESKAGRLLIKNYQNTIKQDKNLHGLFSLCENIRKAYGKDNSLFFKMLSEIEWGVNAENLDESTKKIADIVMKSYNLLENKAKDVIPDEKKALNEAILFIAENKRTMKNISEYAKYFNVLNEEISQHPEENISSNEIDDVFEEKLNEFNEEFSDALDDEEAEIVNDINETKNGEYSFDKYKEKCRAKISEKISECRSINDTETAERLSVINERLEKKNYNPDTLLVDLVNFIELEKTIK